MTTSPAPVERLTEEDWPSLREVRLRALADAPEAFWATLEDEAGHDEARWRSFARAAAWFVVRDGGRVVGVAAGLPQVDDPAEPQVISMWVDPASRGGGLGARLLGAVVDWVRGTGARAVRLSVADGNDGARRLYERHGFVGTGVRAELPHTPGAYEELLRLPLDTQPVGGEAPGTEVPAVRFPAGFAWGTATASYQVEGAVHADGRSASIWDTFSHTPGRISDGSTGDVTDDHYTRYREDVGLLADVGVGWYRFSLAWPRLQPDGRGPLNSRGVDFYARLLDELLDRGIKPWVTLYHWDLPQVLEDAGGWPERDTALRFADYADQVHAALGDRVPCWTTLNEPWCSSMLGYASGAHAPGRTEPAAALRAVHHLLLGHGLATTAMRERLPDALYGVTLNLHPYLADSARPEDLDAARRIDGVANRLFLDPVLRGAYPGDVVADLAAVSDFGHVRDGDLAAIAAPLDLLGVNYYFRQRVRATGRRPDPTAPVAWIGSDDVEPVSRGLPVTDIGWEIDPDGLHDVLTRLHRDYGPLPLYITENGAAYPDGPGPDGQVHDPARIEYLDAHLRAAARALADGVDLRGYFVWSLLDNFEWAFGFSKRFGLVHVDYATLRRTPKDSARWFAGVTRRNGLQAG